MAKEVAEVTVKGNRLVCPVCRNTQFWHRKTQMNTRGATFLKVDWANKNADNYVCSNCGHIMWFFE